MNKPHECSSCIFQISWNAPNSIEHCFVCGGQPRRETIEGFSYVNLGPKSSEVLEMALHPSKPTELASSQVLCPHIPSHFAVILRRISAFNSALRRLSFLSFSM